MSRIQSGGPQFGESILPCVNKGLVRGRFSYGVFAKAFEYVDHTELTRRARAENFPAYVVKLV